VIFPADQITKIINGQKTQHRIKVKRAKTGKRAGALKPIQAKPGDTLAIQHYDPDRAITRTAQARVFIQHVTRQPIGNLTIEDAQAEGFPTREAFIDYWTNLHGHKTFHPEHDVWVITFTVDRSEPALLMAKQSELGYTTSHDQAVRDTDEAPVDAETLERWAQDARADRADRQKQIAAKRLAGRTRPEDRLEELRKIAHERGVDVRTDVKAIERRLDSIEKRINRREAA
jgi:hypothetical protein